MEGRATLSWPDVIKSTSIIILPQFCRERGGEREVSFFRRLKINFLRARKREKERKREREREKEEKRKKVMK